MEPLEGNTADPLRSDPVFTKLERIATLAKQMPDKALFTLNHCLDRDLRNWLNRQGGGWVLDVDVRKYFDTIDHARLREFLRRRVRDGVLLRLIGKWLKAGVLEEGILSYPGEGTPQGGVISPLLANIYLHYVLDEWFEEEIKPVLAGEAKLIRFADDFVLAFTRRRDAERVFAVLGQRFAKYGLTLHPKKTRLVRFQRPGRVQDSSDGGHTKPETFELLGFRWYWGRMRSGGWTVKTQTAAGRVSRTITRIDDWCRRHRHDPIPTQQMTLSRKLQGHYNYYARRGNYYAISRVYRGVLRAWRKWLGRRSWKARLTWARFEHILARHPLPLPQIRVEPRPR